MQGLEDVSESRDRVPVVREEPDLDLVDALVFEGRIAAAISAVVPVIPAATGTPPLERADRAPHAQTGW